ncbi:MAG: hypothetical protein EZS28_046173 [Streblomastix strix]|uniref:DDE-1 domain-containing protein n=1 Tax=Streblomastix strix TaxID=222440 RepID=A0A5J4TLA1_9EUKA|nr:MAG: hypothetical protein EZS28_046173 [Streblomastix strix]
MVLVKSTMKATRRQPRKLAECDELFLIQEMTKMIKSSSADKARKIVALIKIYYIKNASDVILDGLVGSSKQYINEIRSYRTYKKKHEANFQVRECISRVEKKQKKLGIKEYTARQQQRMKIKNKDVDAFQVDLKKYVKDKFTNLFINADEIGIQTYGNNRPQCVIVPSEYMDDDIHFGVDHLETLVSVMIAIAQNGVML